MSKIRVLEVAKSTGGLGTYMRWLAKGFDRSRFDLNFVCLSEGSAELASELVQTYDVKTLHWPMNRFKLDLFGDALIIWQLARLIRREKYDIVHGHGSKAGFIVRLASVGTNTKTIYSPHNFAFHARQKPLLAFIYALIENLAARLLTTRIITVSHAERVSAEQWGLPTERFVTVHSGIEIDLFEQVGNKQALCENLRIPSNAILVGTVGSLVEAKAPLDFVRVAAKVHERIPNAYFVWVGEGQLGGAAKQLSVDLGIVGHIIFPGQRNDVPRILSALDCFLLTSHWEAFPIVILEAMAACVPIVATNLVGTQEAITHQVEGLIAPVGDIDALSSAVIQILTRDDLGKLLCTNARQRVECEFTHKLMMSKLMQVYEQVATSEVA